MSDPVKFEPFSGLKASPPRPAQPPAVVTPQIKPLDFKTTDTTRFLSAAAYTNAFLRNRVFEQVIDEKHKAIVASSGVDVATVAGHCLMARRKKVVRDGLIFALTVLLLITYAAVYDPLTSTLFTFLIFLVAWGIVFFDSYVIRYNVLGTYFTKKNFDPNYAGSRLGAEQQSRVKEIAAAQRGNVVVYGGFSPFVGSGLDIGGWSFTAKVNKGKEEHGHRLTPLPVQLEELHAALTKSILDLGLDGVSIEDKLYVDGQEIRDDTTFLHHPLGRPVATVDPVMVKRFMEQPTSAVRHYKCIQAISWKAELVLSIFIRFAKIKNSLFAETSYFLLPPLQESYHEVDSLHPDPTLREVLELLVVSAFKTPLMFLYSTYVTFNNIFRPFSKWRAEAQVKKAIRKNPSFNYGAMTSIRESATSDKFRRYFQKLDKEMNVKILERQILDCIVDFLESKNIDTSDLKERQETILNYGVIVSGGSIQAQSFAVGQQARAQVSKLAGAVGFSPLNLQPKKGKSN